MANTYLYKAQPGVGSSIKSTFSGWIKVANDNLTGGIYGQYYNANYNFDICLQTGNLEVADYLVNQYKMRKRTTQKLRDLNAWYHIYVAIDRSLSTAADRTKVYINGERVTDFQSAEDANYTQQTSGSHDGNCKMNNLGGATDFSRVGIRYDGNEFDGCMSHIHWVDGSVIDIAQFGSTDSTTGEWQINTSPTISSYGQTGFSCLQNGNTITDQSPNSNNFTSSGNGVTKTEDNPSNVFCTLNPLGTYKDNHNGHNWLQNGNTKINTDGRSEFDWLTDFGTIGATSGKYYMELKITQIGSVSGVDYGSIGIANDDAMSDSKNGTYGRESNDWGSGVYAYSFRFDSRNASSIALIKREDGSSTKTNSYQTQSSELQVVMMAWDLDNGKIWFGREGSWFNSGNPSAGTYPALTFTPNGRTFLPYVNHWIHNSGNNPIYSVNFGNGYFSTSTVASEGNNASGNGIFEYDTPTGFTALSTKGLNL